MIGEGGTGKRQAWRGALAPCSLRGLRGVLGVLGVLGVISLAGLGVVALAGCDKGGRFPVCKTSADCAATQAGAGSVCYNLRCVECRYDTDCPAGRVCNSANECLPLSSSAPAEKNDGAVKWDPGSWDECAEACKDQACVKKCNERFER